MNETRINYYLTSLESILRTALPLSRCAEIIVEVRARIQTQLDAGSTLDEILSRLGPVDRLAREYGVFYKPQSSLSARIAKWIFLISLITFLIFSILIWKLSNTIHTSFEKFSFEDLPDQFSIGGLTIPDGPDQFEDLAYEEQETINGGSVKTIRFLFSNGKVRISTNDTDKISWRCRVKTNEKSQRSKALAETVEINYSDVFGVKCDVQVPRDISLIVKGGNGDLKIIKPDFNVDAEIINGRVQILPDESIKYKFDFKVTNGRAEEFKSSNDTNSKKIKVTLSNGVITSSGD